MLYNDEEEAKFKNVINSLKELSKVNAPDYFEADLMRKINAGSFETQKSFWSKFLTPSTLIPSAVLAVTVIVILFMVNFNSVEQDDPLLANPRLREDMIPANEAHGINVEQLAQKEAKQNKNMEKSGSSVSPNGKLVNKSMSKGNGDLADSEYSQKYYSANNSKTGTFSNGFTIRKSGLNFRMVNLNPAEKVKVNQLKAKMMRDLRKN